MGKRKDIKIKTVSYVHVNGVLTNTDDLTPEQKVKLANWIKLTWCSALYQGKAEFLLAEDGKQPADVE